MSENNKIEEKSVPFFPDHLLYEAKVALWFGIGLVILGIIGMFKPVGLGEPADPMVTPEHTKPEWYFLALFQLLKYLPKTIGALLPVVLVLLIIIWPFLDNKPDKSKLTTRNRFIITTILVVITIVLTILGEVT
jgi:quinol-cytochrome oxidoreductase complex cytochrome b subunit